MRLFGIEISRVGSTQVAPEAPATVKSAETPSGGFVDGAGRGGWFGVVREPFTGAWQRGLREFTLDNVFSNVTLFRCISLIAGDIAKLRPCLTEETSDGVFVETASPAYSPVLKKPNAYQNAIQFYQAWLVSKLAHGNAYVLKIRDARRVVVELHVLDPRRVRPLITPSGEVWYQTGIDYLAGLEGPLYVPASEIIHDRWNCLFHPLVGLSPIYACGLAAVEGVEIARHATRFFTNSAQPGGILTSPNHIEDDTAERLKKEWEERFTGDNAGRIAIAGDGLDFKSMAFNAVDSQLIEQLKFTAEQVCSALGVPAYKVGVGTAPLNNNVEALEAQYYSGCVQIHIESLELCLEEGLGAAPYRIEFDLDGLLRMDQASRITSLADAVKGGVMKPDEARGKLNLPPVPGGDQVYLQQQNYSLEALAKRDAKDDPFAKGEPAAGQPPAADDGANDNDAERASANARAVIAFAERSLVDAARS